MSEPKFKIDEPVWAISTNWIKTHEQSFSSEDEDTSGTKFNYIPTLTKIYEIPLPRTNWEHPTKTKQYYRLNEVSWWNPEEDIFHTQKECEERAEELRKENIKNLHKAAKFTLKRLEEKKKYIQKLINNNFQ